MSAAEHSAHGLDNRPLHYSGANYHYNQQHFIRDTMCVLRSNNTETDSISCNTCQGTHRRPPTYFEAFDVQISAEYIKAGSLRKNYLGNMLYYLDYHRIKRNATPLMSPSFGFTKYNQGSGTDTLETRTNLPVIQRGLKLINVNAGGGTNQFIELDTSNLPTASEDFTIHWSGKLNRQDLIVSIDVEREALFFLGNFLALALRATILIE